MNIVVNMKNNRYIKSSNHNLLKNKTDMAKNIASALYQKYCSSTNFCFISQIDQIRQEQISIPNIEYQQMKLLSQYEQYMKRQYFLDQFQEKIDFISQYYKFKRELPKIVDKSIQRAIQKYHQKLRAYDFKKVKAAIKRQQGISITQQNNQSSSIRSQQQPIKSKYSNVLHELQQSRVNQSIILKNICQKIGLAFRNIRPCTSFKGYFEKNSKNFQEYLNNQKLSNHFKNTIKINNLNQTKNKQNIFNINTCQRGLSIKINTGSIRKILKNSNKSGQSKLEKKKNYNKQKKIPMPLGIKNINSLKNVKANNFVNINRWKKIEYCMKQSRNYSIHNFTQNFQKIVGQPSKKSIDKILSRPDQKKIDKKSLDKEKSKCREIVSLSKKNRMTIIKSPSFSKSRSSLNKQNSRQNLHLRQKSTCSNSNLSQTMAKKFENNDKATEMVQINKLLNKKLSIFIRM